VAVIDGTLAAQKAMSAILRTGERFGSEHLISLLIGEETEQIRKFGHARLPTFGVGKEHSRAQWRSIFRQLYAGGIVSLDITDFGRWRVTDAGRAVLKGKATIQLRQDMVTAGKKAARKAAAASALGDSEDDKDLFRALRVRRSALAKAQAVPAYVVLPDRSLIDMVHRKPATLAEMAEVHGIGEAKLARYGQEFLAVIRQYQESA
jgi:ATP-dependent DNA helicase RecQ